MFKFVARPGGNCSDSEKFAGAYINAYVDEVSESAAMAVARWEVEETGWQIESVETKLSLRREDFDDGSPGLEYYEQALLDRCVLVFHTWPAGIETEEVKH